MYTHLKIQKHCFPNISINVLSFHERSILWNWIFLKVESVRSEKITSEFCYVYTGRLGLLAYPGRVLHPAVNCNRLMIMMRIRVIALEFASFNHYLLIARVTAAGRLYMKVCWSEWCPGAWAVPGATSPASTPASPTHLYTTGCTIISPRKRTSLLYKFKLIIYRIQGTPWFELTPWFQCMILDTPVLKVFFLGNNKI